MICRLTLHLWFLESQKSKFSIFPALKGLQKCDKSLLENASGFLLQNATVLLQNVTGITKCDSFITKCDRYYKMRQLIGTMHEGH